MPNTGWTFPPEFNSSGGQISMSVGTESIKKSLLVLFTTHLNEREKHPGFGCDLQQFIFEPITNQLLIFVEDQIRTVIEKHEPRISQLSIEINITEEVAEMLVIKIRYFLEEYNIQDNFTYLLNLQPS